MKFLYLIIFFLIKYSTSKDFVYKPPSREQDVIEESDYTFGIIEDDTTNITYCYYTTDTEISGSFEVVKKAPKPPETEDQLENYFDNPQTKFIHNEVTNRGQGGACEMTIRWATDKGPTTWMLTPFDNHTDGYVGNYSAITYKINFFYKPKFLLPKISIYSSESFYQYLNVTNINFRTCTLTFNNARIELLLDSNKINYFMTPYSKDDEETIKKISSFGHGFCGFMVKNATSAESLKWTITATDDKGKSYRNSFTSTVSPKIPESVRNTKQLVSLGERRYVNCGDRYQQNFCTLYNPSGNLAYTNSDSDCTHEIPTVSMNDIGIWKCITMKKIGMETVTYTVELIIEKKIGEKELEIWANETDTIFTIGCQIINYYSSFGISFCKITTPNHRVISPIPGVATDRYLSFGTDFKRGICAIEIPKPLEDIENGLWQCEIYAGGGIFGEFINVGATEVPDYPKKSNVTLQLEQPYKIQCQVPYSSEYCYIKAPNGTIYQAKSVDEPHVGKCSFKIMAINVTDNGTWTCSFARGTGLPDEEIFVDITVAEVFQYYRSAEVNVGNVATLMCKSGGLPFQYCRFIAPNGTGYQITNHQTSNTISYYGKGFEYGECGITIANTRTSDSGYWTCVARIGSDFSQPEIKAQINLEVNPSLFDDPNIAAAVGIAVGVVVVTSVLVIVGVQKWRRRRHSEVSGSTIQPRRINNDDDNNDNNSEQLDIFSVAPVPRSYTNPDAGAAEDWHAHQL